MKASGCWGRQPGAGRRPRRRQSLGVLPLLVAASHRSGLVGGGFGGGGTNVVVVEGFSPAVVAPCCATGPGRPRTEKWPRRRTVAANLNGGSVEGHHHHLCRPHRSHRPNYSHHGDPSLSRPHRPSMVGGLQIQRQTTASTSTSLGLFFRSRDNGRTRTATRRRPVSSKTLDVLQSPNIALPLPIQFEDEDRFTVGVGAANNPTPWSSSSKEGLGTAAADKEMGAGELILRFMAPDDLGHLVPLCVNEFGTGPTMRLGQFPWYDPATIPAWWDRFYFETMVFWALKAKMAANQEHGCSTATPGGRPIKDPAMLVLCRRVPRRLKKEEQALNTQQQQHHQQQQQQEQYEERAVGMVELSLQPPEFDKNPPAFPVPRWIKEKYSEAKKLGPLQGWVTNLLVAPTSRGMGYSKILMKATEGIAKGWGCKYIYLHADADIRSGRVPQKLYETLGYEIVSSGSGNDDFAWAGLDRFSAIQMVDGAALLCFSKRLEPGLDEGPN